MLSHIESLNITVTDRQKKTDRARFSDEQAHIKTHRQTRVRTEKKQDGRDRRDKKQKTTDENQDKTGDKDGGALWCTLRRVGGWLCGGGGHLLSPPLRWRFASPLVAKTARCPRQGGGTLEESTGQAGARLVCSMFILVTNAIKSSNCTSYLTNIGKFIRFELILKENRNQKDMYIFCFFI